MLMGLWEFVRAKGVSQCNAFNEEDLRRILAKYATYYNENVSIGKDAPYARPIERLENVVARPILGGLHHQYARI
jgi:hypothetical protein